MYLLELLSHPKKSIAVFSSISVFVVNYEWFSTDITKYYSLLSQNMRQNLVKVCTKESLNLISNLIPPTSVQYTFQLNKIFYILSCSTRACTFDVIFFHFKYTYFQTTAFWWQKDRERHRTVIIIDDKCKSETCDEEKSLPHH